ncbi:MAG TPA: chaperone modulator CbpM [Woeseiaceae bacterium]|nr:chaperone modulator CbpM [Woeseiaceae bacterium]
MTDKVLNGILIDERIELTLHDLEHACACSTEWVLELVDEGVLEARGDDPRSLRFGGASLARALRATRLKRDLGLNLPGIALAIEMLDEIEALRVQLRRIEASDLDQ